MELLVSAGDRNRCRARRRPELHGVPHDALILVMSSRLAARAGVEVLIAFFELQSEVCCSRKTTRC
jgi:hypothetical protein